MSSSSSSASTAAAAAPSLNEDKAEGGSSGSTNAPSRPRDRERDRDRDRDRRDYQRSRGGYDYGGAGPRGGYYHEDPRPMYGDAGWAGPRPHYDYGYDYEYDYDYRGYHDPWRDGGYRGAGPGPGPAPASRGYERDREREYQRSTTQDRPRREDPPPAAADPRKRVREPSPAASTSTSTTTSTSTRTTAPPKPDALTRTQARRAASRSATAKDDLSSGLDYDDDDGSAYDESDVSVSARRGGKARSPTKLGTEGSPLKRAVMAGRTSPPPPTAPKSHRERQSTAPPSHRETRATPPSSSHREKRPTPPPPSHRDKRPTPPPPSHREKRATPPQQSPPRNRDIEERWGSRDSVVANRDPNRSRTRPESEQASSSHNAHPLRRQHHQRTSPPPTSPAGMRSRRSRSRSIQDRSSGHGTGPPPSPSPSTSRSEKRPRTRSPEASLRQRRDDGPSHPPPRRSPSVQQPTARPTYTHPPPARSPPRRSPPQRSPPVQAPPRAQPPPTRPPPPPAAQAKGPSPAMLAAMEAMGAGAAQGTSTNGTRIVPALTTTAASASPDQRRVSRRDEDGDEDDEDDQISTAALAALTPPARAMPTELYTRIAQVGEGTYGQVFKARSEQTGIFVALKKIRMEAEKDGFPITAMREIKLLQMLRHPNVVRLHEMMTARTSVYMVFEYMEHDLNGVLNHPNIHFAPCHLKSLAGQLLEGLEYLHHKSVLHRDLKGSNILLNNAGLLKLADFGLARLYSKRKLDSDYTNRVVTLWYRPPELLLGETRYNDRIDIWGAGCIFLELFTRKAVFCGQDEIHQLKTIVDVMGPFTEERWKGVMTLPWFELIRPNEGVEEGEGDWGDKFRKRYEKLMSPAALDVAQALLQLDPSKRTSAADALKMPYFVQEKPRAVLPSKILSGIKGEWHELESRRARQRGGAR